MHARGQQGLWIALFILCISSPSLSAEQVNDSGPPLHTEGRYVVDGNGHRFKFASVSWYGAEEMDYVVAGLEIEDLQTIARRIAEMGFNSVRLPWSNEMLEGDPIVQDTVVAANPALQGKHAMEVFDAVIDALASEGLLVILDNHMSRADWCCNDTDSNGLWYTPDYPEAAWIADWQTIVQRYASQPAVVAVDLRNEPRCVRGVGCATWGGPNRNLDWAAAAERAGNAVLSINPDLLVIVEGINYAADLRGARTRPIQLEVEKRLVYSTHDYSWFHRGLRSHDQLRRELDSRWGFLLEPDQPYTAPVWAGEFGTCHFNRRCIEDSTPGSSGFWFSGFTTYLYEKDIDWAYWPVNGTQARGTGREFGAEEIFGIFNRSWSAPALPDLLDRLQEITAPASVPDPQALSTTERLRF